eukprot:4337932-Pleurochrysis_carterae.AAC.1
MRRATSILKTRGPGPLRDHEIMHTDDTADAVSLSHVPTCTSEFVPASALAPFCSPDSRDTPNSHSCTPQTPTAVLPKLPQLYSPNSHDPKPHALTL